jgi:hypothetical protein
MKSPLFLFALLVVLIGCKKEKSAAPAPPPASTTIVKYTDLTPDVSFTSVRGYSSVDQTNCSYTLPDDSTASASFDIDQDNVLDFRVVMTHTVAHSCNHCLKSTLYNINIQSLNAQAMINVTQAGPMRPVGETIKTSDSWNQTSSMIYSMGCAGTPNVDKKYCGVKVNNKVGWIYFEQANASRVVITAFAINAGTSGTIAAGQTN